MACTPLDAAILARVKGVLAAARAATTSEVVGVFAGSAASLRFMAKSQRAHNTRAVSTADLSCHNARANFGAVVGSHRSEQTRVWDATSEHDLDHVHVGKTHAQLLVPTTPPLAQARARRLPTIEIE